MKFTHILCITHRQPVPGTKTCIEDCMRKGAYAVMPSGYADISSGRSTEITRSMDWMVDKKWDPQVGVLVKIDDDMHFSPEQVQELVDYVRETGRPASGIYGGSNGRVVVNNQDGCEWEVGCGFMAIRLDHLLRVASQYERVRGMYERGVIPFSCSGVHPSLPDRYTGDDFWLCREFGGFDLLRIGVGHYKQIPLWPDDQTLDKLIRKEKLPGVVPKHQLQGRRLSLHSMSKEYEHCGQLVSVGIVVVPAPCIRAKGHKGQCNSTLPEQEFPSAEHPDGWTLT